MAAIDVQRSVGARHRPLPPQPARSHHGPHGPDGRDAGHGLASISAPTRPQAVAGGCRMKRLRRITEAEVIAEFLRGEFFHSEFDAYREQLAAIVDHPNLTDDAENALRRALFFRRRDTLWWELPEDRQWWEIEFEPADVDRVSVFPRAHWLRLSRGNLMATHVAEKVRQQLAQPHPEDVVRK